MSRIDEDVVTRRQSDVRRRYQTSDVVVQMSITPAAVDEFCGVLDGGLRSAPGLRIVRGGCAMVHGPHRARNVWNIAKVKLGDHRGTRTL